MLGLLFSSHSLFLLHQINSIFYTLSIFIYPPTRHNAQTPSVCLRHC